jgi:hypothetical protein
MHPHASCIDVPSRIVHNRASMHPHASCIDVPSRIVHHRASMHPHASCIDVPSRIVHHRASVLPHAPSSPSIHAYAAFARGSSSSSPFTAASAAVTLALDSGRRRSRSFI